MTKHMQPRAGVATRPPLVIRRIDAIPIALPLKKPMKMAGVTIATADNVLVRVEADGGLVGWGEAASAPTMSGDTQGGLVAAIRYLAPLIVGEDAWTRPAPMWRLGNATPEEDAAEARDKLAQGFRFFKVKVGVKSVDGDIAGTRAVRAA